MYHFLFITFVILFSFQDAGWELKKDKSGIEVYTRSVEGSSFMEFKGITKIPNSSIDEVLDVILDVKNYESLFPDCVNPKVLKQDGKWYDIHYIKTKGPFPVKDRDSVFEQITEIDENGKHARVKLNPLPDYIPEKEDIVRIRNGTGFWELEENNNNEVKVIYQFHGEPGGDIPAWLANSFVVTHPFKTMQNLKKRLKSE
jgi:hypothetical protein